MINRRKRRDSNHQAILDAFKRLGWSVIDTSQLGGSVADCVVAREGRVVAVEIKTATGKVKPSQAAWLASWQAETAVVRDIGDVIALTRGEVLTT